MDISTNTVKGSTIVKPKETKPLMSAGMKPKIRKYDFDPVANPEAMKMARIPKTGQGPLHSSQLREMADNKRRLEASAALRAARAKIAKAAAAMIEPDRMAKARAAKAAKAAARGKMKK